MELTAVIEALGEVISRAEGRNAEVIVSTDSQYVQKGITVWIRTWERNGWKTSGKKPVKNGELWARLLELSRRISVRWTWVMGHAGHDMNERCDALVQSAISAGLKRRG
jgi:ribonuclease HI